MNKSLKLLAAILGLAGGLSVYARTTQFRAPLMMERGVFHYPLDQVDETWWYEMHEKDCCWDSCWFIDTWSSYYQRQAGKAFIDSCDPDKNTTQTAPLSELFFGKSSFRGEETLPGGIVELNPSCSCVTPSNLSWARITPNFKYVEKGAYFGIHGFKTFGCDCDYRYGFRASMPFKIIEVEQTGGKLEETINDVFCECCFNVNTGVEANAIDFAYRLDFLSSLVRCGIPATEQSRAVVEYSPNTGIGDSATQISTIPVGFADPANSPVYVTKRLDGSCPPPTQIVPTSPHKARGRSVQSVSNPLPADGSAINNTTHNFNDESINYKAALGQDRDAQGSLFVVPKINVENGIPTSIQDQAQTIRGVIVNLVENAGVLFEESVVDFFRNNCIDLAASEYIAALGDLETEFYVGHYNDYWFADVLTGVRFPTGQRINDCKRIYAQTTGHNGHFELKFGLEGGYQPWDWFAVRADAIFNHAFNAKENVAAPFAGAQTRNIGLTCINADINWNYYEAHFDLNFFHPCNADLGFVLGYELFGKQNDRVDLCSTRLTDAFGNTAELDPTILETNTNAMLHKIHGDVFHRWNFCEFILGASHAVAGRQAMKETEVHICVNFWF